MATIGAYFRKSYRERQPFLAVYDLVALLLTAFFVNMGSYLHECFADDGYGVGLFLLTAGN